jgi:outer membrane lipoprotein carrier protein
MRWSYEEPEESLVVTDGSTLWTWDPGLGEAQRVPVGEGFLSGAAIQFLLGEGNVLDTFAVESDSCEGKRVVLRLLPYNPASYEKLLLEVDPADGAVHSTEVVDLLGNATRVAFSDVRTNTAPKDDTFRFTPPKGARVIEVPAAP